MIVSAIMFSRRLKMGTTFSINAYFDDSKGGILIPVLTIIIYNFDITAKQELIMKTHSSVLSGTATYTLKDAQTSRARQLIQK